MGNLTDCHRDKAPEAFAAINLRNIYSFGMNYFISSWIDSQGPKEVFCIYWGIHVFICLTAIPMYIYGRGVAAGRVVWRYSRSDESLNVVR